ncbi:MULTISPECIES: hypothetical protein [Curtobacterium]|jgi:plasmid maintenance system killer protein|uniref:Plasmid maintenance system killer protein n=1 Tax=Curtobacterium flaccumfaciens pv. flaccumfaciens TaxID=138532 RepID=A0A9Q2W4F6_9MICO|nr:MULTISPECIES: hypothetical protein [Curtobacterium]KIQ05766.1 hypothetical protein RU06_12590 [Curtobacterium flaccumfaciens]MBT1542230.1 hypothetical protein [Curtobacterium flaccumfaciens pv. flaccumfaciens]MBT1595680.1 hypothetical protein [Curtobacterium flaccumfaciens pv. flaccumfaciens]VXC20673.1 Plasmid maintenance system killer protein [Curtobacterium sp. 8I-2]
MEVLYSDKKLRQICTSDKAMRKAHPEPIPKNLRNRIKQLESALVVADVLDGLGKWHPLTGRGVLVYGASLSANYRLVVQFSETGSSCTAEVQSIEDYH